MSFNDAGAEMSREAALDGAPSAGALAAFRVSFALFRLAMVHICRYEVRQVAQFTEFPQAEN